MFLRPVNVIPTGSKPLTTYVTGMQNENSRTLHRMHVPNTTRTLYE